MSRTLTCNQTRSQGRYHVMIQLHMLGPDLRKQLEDSHMKMETNQEPILQKKERRL
jgi:hypothetical protein